LPLAVAALTLRGAKPQMELERWARGAEALNPEWRSPLKLDYCPQLVRRSQVHFTDLTTRKVKGLSANGCKWSCLADSPFFCHNAVSGIVLHYSGNITSQSYSVGMQPAPTLLLYFCSSVLTSLSDDVVNYISCEIR
jgi:hypothetical protein